MHPEEQPVDSPVVDGAPQLSDEEIDNLPTTMPPISIQMRGFEKTDADEIGAIIYFYIQSLGKFINLERLEAVTVAHDYVETLAAINHGFPSQHVLTPTRDKYGTGIAMTATVLRDGQPRSHIVLDANYMRAIVSEDAVSKQVTVHTLAHECFHVHDLLMQDRAYPGVFGCAIPDYRDGYLFQYAQPCWEEYIAQKFSAPFAAEMETEGYESTFCRVFDGVQDRVKVCIRDYISHKDISRLMVDLHHEYGGMLKYLAYLAGHIRGLEQGFPVAAPKAHKTIEEVQFFSPLFPRFVAALEAMHQTYGEWSGREIFEPLKSVVEDLLKTVGVSFSPRPNGQWFVSVNALYVI